MSGELRTSQFRWTTTTNDDFVIGSPDEASLHNTKFLVFQTSAVPGYGSNPHIRCDYTGGAWKLKINQTGSGADTSLENIAYTNGAAGVNNVLQTFTGPNTFSGDVTLGASSSNALTVNSTATFNSGVTINGTLAVVNTTNLTVKDSLITLNKGGAAASAGGAGIEFEENFAISSYFKVSASRSAWDIKAPLASVVTLTMPASSGTVALTSDLHAAVTLGTANGLSLAGQAVSLGLSTTSTTGALSSTDWNTFNGKAQLDATQTITGQWSFPYIILREGATNYKLSVSGGTLNIVVV